MAVPLTDHMYFVIDRFLDSVLARARAGQITWVEAQNEIAEAIEKIVQEQPDALEYMELRGGRLEQMPEEPQRRPATQRKKCREA